MKQHTDWLKAQIQSIPAFASKTFVTTTGAVTPTLPYVLIHPADGSDTAGRNTGPRTDQHPRFTIHTVGGSTDQVAAGAKLIKEKLVVGGFGVTPTIANELCGRVDYDSPIPIQTDTDVTPWLIYHVAEVGFETTPTS